MVLEGHKKLGRHARIREQVRMGRGAGSEQGHESAVVLLQNALQPFRRAAMAGRLP